MSSVIFCIHPCIWTALTLTLIAVTLCSSTATSSVRTVTSGSARRINNTKPIKLFSALSAHFDSIGNNRTNRSEIYGSSSLALPIGSTTTTTSAVLSTNLTDQVTFAPTSINSSSSSSGAAATDEDDKSSLHSNTVRRLTHVIPFRVLLALPPQQTPQLARAMRDSLAKWQSGALYKPTPVDGGKRFSIKRRFDSWNSSRSNDSRPSISSNRPIAYRLFVSPIPLTENRLQALPTICDQLQIYNPLLLLSFVGSDQLHDLQMVAEKTLVPLVTFTGDYFRPSPGVQVKFTHNFSPFAFFQAPPFSHPSPTSKQHLSITLSSGIRRLFAHKF
jgi:hypothetical protein